MKPLEEMLMQAAALRQRRTPSVMNQTSAPQWQPEYEKEPPLEQVSPEDFIPNPKTAAALMAKGGMAGVTVPWMSKKTIEALRNEFAYTNNNAKSKAGLAMLRPTDFLKATVPNEHSMSVIVDRAGRFDPFMMQNTGQHPFLDLAKTAVKGHEGRHRTSGALASTEGEEVMLPYVIRSGTEGKMPDVFEAMSNKKYSGQAYPKSTGHSSPVRVGEITPINYENDLDKFVTNLEVPLANIGVALKPEGALATAENLRMFRRPIPFGKIPPPKPRTNE